MEKARFAVGSFSGISIVSGHPNDTPEVCPHASLRIQESGSAARHGFDP